MPSLQVERQRRSCKGTRELHLSPAGRRVAFNPVAASGLSLPFISSAVPSGATLVSSANITVKFAESLAEADVLKPRHWTGELVSATHAAIAEITQTELLSINFGYTDDPSRGAFSSQGNDEQGWGLELDDYKHNEAVGSNGLWGIATWSPDTQFWFVGEYIEHLESLRPQLGQTVLSLLYQAFRQSIGAVTPFSVKDMAEWVYSWDDDDPEDKDRYREKGFDGQMPKFMSKPSRLDLDLTKIKLNVKRNATLMEVFAERDREVLRLAQELRGMILNPIDNHIGRIECPPTQVMMPVALRYNVDDPTIRVIDDVYEMEASGDGVNELTFLHFFTLDEVKATFNQLRRMFDMVRVAEKILSLIGVREQRYRQ